LHTDGATLCVLTNNDMARLLLILLGLVWVLAGCVETEVVPDPEAPLVAPMVVISPVDTSLLVGQALQYQARFYNERGQLATTTFTWSTSNAAVATLSASANANLLSAGQATITARAADGSVATALLTAVVDQNQVAGFQVTVPTRLGVGETIQLVGVAVNLQGVPVQGATVAWEISNTSLAQLNAGNVLQALAAGTFTLTAVSGTTRSAAYQVTVEPAERVATIVPGPIQGEAARGTARLVTLPSGGLELRFDSNFQTDSGPGLFIYLSNCAIVNGSNASSCARVELGALKSRTGAQSYTVPPEVTINQYSHVLVLCKPFLVTFGTGELRTP
jgi:hypothetical protein